MNEEEREAKKSFVLKLGVSVIIAIVFFLWAANLKGVFKSKQVEPSDATWQRVSEEMDRGMKDIEEKINDLQASSTKENFIEDLIDKTDQIASSSVSTSSAILDIKKELSDLTSSTSTSTTTPVKKTGCPAFINCMPTIGEARPCVIPAGCEGITQIAY